MNAVKRPFIEHLEEFRRRILISLVSVIAASVLSYAFAGRILEFLARYVDRLIFISPQEAFLANLKISVISGVVLSAPVILYNALRFAWTALEQREKALFAAYFASGLVLFAAGALFSFFVAIPAGMRFLLGFSTDLVRPYISVSRYVSFVGFLVIAFSVCFEVPLLVAFFTRLGILSSDFLARKRRYCVVLLFVVAALITPPDVITQVLLAVPLIALYEISVLVSRAAEKKKRG